MVLVDTSVWVSHFRSKDLRLENLLLNDRIYCHPFIIGELACGRLDRRAEILRLLSELPVAKEATHLEVLAYIEKFRLMGKGLGLIDAHVLSSAALSDLSVWTQDRPMQQVARQLKMSYV